MRVFYALPLEDSVRDALAEAAVRMRLCAKGRYVRPDAYHMTLAFVGEVQPQALPALNALLDAAAALIPPPALALTGPGTFGQHGNAILWHGVSGAEPLEQVSHALVAGLKRLGLPCDDKAFKPHITLARQVDLGQADMALAQAARVAWRAGRIALFESRREDAGMAYVPLYSRAFGLNAKG